MQLLEKKIPMGINVLVAASQRTRSVLVKIPVCVPFLFTAQQLHQAFALAAEQFWVILYSVYLPSRRSGLQEARSSCCTVVLYKHKAGVSWHPVSRMSSAIAGAAMSPPAGRVPGVFLWILYSCKYRLSYCTEMRSPSG